MMCVALLVPPVPAGSGGNASAPARMIRISRCVSRGSSRRRRDGGAWRKVAVVVIVPRIRRSRRRRTTPATPLWSTPPATSTSSRQTGRSPGSARRRVGGTRRTRMRSARLRVAGAISRISIPCASRTPRDGTGRCSSRTGRGMLAVMRVVLVLALVHPTRRRWRR